MFPSGLKHRKHEVWFFCFFVFLQFYLALLLSVSLKWEWTFQLIHTISPPEMIPLQGFWGSDFPFCLRAVKHSPDSALMWVQRFTGAFWQENLNSSWTKEDLTVGMSQLAMLPFTTVFFLHFWLSESVLHMLRRFSPLEYSSGPSFWQKTCPIPFNQTYCHNA